MPATEVLLLSMTYPTTRLVNPRVWVGFWLIATRPRRVLGRVTLATTHPRVEINK
jgi:hypothetical protein